MNSAGVGQQRRTKRAMLRSGLDLGTQNSWLVAGVL